MKKKTDDRDWHEKRIEEVRRKDSGIPPAPAGKRGRPGRSGAGESAGSRETFPQRTRKPGEVGLANEPRPGLGSRADDDADETRPTSPPPDAKGPGKPKATPRGYEEPRPAPRDQPPDSRAHDEERSTGISGQSSGT